MTSAGRFQKASIRPKPHQTPSLSTSHSQVTHRQAVNELFLAPRFDLNYSLFMW